MKRRARGFTLIELVVTVALVGILASIAVPIGELSVQRAREQELRSALRQIREAIDAYKLATDEGRVARAADASGYPPSLAALVEGVPDARTPTGTRIHFLRRLPRDPFYPDAQANAVQTWGKRAYASPPDAPAEGADVFDVYSLSARTGLDGRVYRAW